ncbi:MAG: glycosyltransferase family 39 protein [Cellvibrionales bacterium]|nr:glycosyltransferase family 39 protein [Cellvibrionales bacterium]
MNRAFIHSFWLYCAIILLLVIFSVYLRSPFFSIYSLDWDEWTFILLGQSVLDGYLPYTHYWDVKPPLVFYGFAGIVSLVGTDIVGVRAAGSIIIAITAFACYLIGLRLMRPLWSVVAAATYITLATRFTPMLMSEHLAVLPLMFGVWALLKASDYDKHAPYYCFLAGVLFTLALYTRLNLAFVPLFVGIAYVVNILLQSKSVQKSCISGVTLVLGFIVVSSVVFLPFAGHVTLFIDSVFLAPLSYAQTKLSAWQVLASQWQHAGGLYRLAYILSLSAIVVLLREWKKGKPVANSLMLIVALLAVELSIAIGGRDFHHYWIQLAPFLALFAVFALSRVAFVSIWAGRVLLVGAYLTFIGLGLVSQQAAKGFSQQDTVPEVAGYLKGQVSPDDTLYTTNQQILYWLLEKEPLSAAILHPSNITKPFLLQHMPGASSEPSKELQRILSFQPTWIVTQESLFYWHSIPGLERSLNAILNQHYQQQTILGQTQIYKRIQSGM